MTRTPVERLTALTFFDVEDYLALNPDLRGGGVDPAQHAFRHGLAEGRTAFRREAIARAWGQASAGPATPTPTETSSVDAAAAACPPVSILVSTGSDPSDIALAADLAESLTRSGVAAVLKDETSSPDGDHGLPVVVAPHSFFNVGLGALWARSDAVERSLVFNTAPLHHRAFERSLPWLLRSRGVLDASPQAARIFQASGWPALLMRFATPLRSRWLAPTDLGHPLVQALPGVARRLDFDPWDWETRPVDIAFFDPLSARRSAVLRRQAAALAERPCFVYGAQGGRDSLDESVERRSHHRLAGHVSGHAKITLQLAKDDFPQFDWHRCVTQIMASGSLVVSDTPGSHPDDDIGRHVFRDDARHLAALTRWLLDDADGRRAASSARESAARAIDRTDPVFSATLRSFLSAAARPNTA